MSDAMSAAAAATTQRGGKGASGATLDFSFRCITAMEDLLTEDPRSVPAEAKARNANAVKAPSQHKTEDAIMAGSGTTSMRVAEVGSLGYASVAPSTDTAQSEHKYDVTALRLNNNALTNLEGFWETTAALIQQPSALAWIDLSFNQLSDIPQVLCELQELRVLYLHGNTVSRLSNVSTLVPLRHLRSLTLHGNPIETENHYRSLHVGGNWSTWRQPTQLYLIQMEQMEISPNLLYHLLALKRYVYCRRYAVHMPAH